MTDEFLQPRHEWRSRSTPAEIMVEGIANALALVELSGHPRHEKVLDRLSGVYALVEAIEIADDLAAEAAAA